MKKNTPTKKEPIKAHRGRIVYEGRGRPIGGGRPQIPRPFPGRPRPFPGRPMPRPMPFPPRRRRPPIRDPRFGRLVGRPRIGDNPFLNVPPRRGLGGSSMAEQALRRAIAERNNMQVSEPINQRQQAFRTALSKAGNKGMVVTKKAIGENDFRKGGLTLSTVDNLKKHNHNKLKFKEAPPK